MADNEEKKIKDLFNSAPYFKDELISFWNNLSDEEKRNHIYSPRIMVDSHREESIYYNQSPVQSVVSSFCYWKRQELLYKPYLWRELGKIDVLEQCDWLRT